MNTNPNVGDSVDARFAAQCQTLRARTDRMFAALMLFQWVAGIVAALIISPKTWSGSASETHIHVWMAIFYGGLLTGFPVLLTWLKPGHWITRHTIAAAQMLTSGLLIHITGGRIETHFHVFGSLAFLAFYRDWRVLITATAVVAADHLLRDIFLPQSIFGVFVFNPWRVLEHAGWVIFIDVVLIFSIRKNIQDMIEVAVREVGLEATNQQLQKEIIERKRSEEEKKKLDQQLLAISRQAGMAEVANGVLHNVGNVLNSVNVSSGQLATTLRQSATGDVKLVAELLRKNSANLGDYLTRDVKGQQIPVYLGQLAETLEQERNSSLTELDSLTGNIDHIKQIISMQQGIARSGGVKERVSVPELFEQALGINMASLDRHDIEVVREFGELPAILTDRHQVLQILVNLISNAKYAMLATNSPVKRLTLRAGMDATRPGFVFLQVVDTGMGIKSENLQRLFAQGFTTKKDGHGFGLHSGALAAKQMGGTMEAASEGEGRGATFTLHLPVKFELPIKLETPQPV